jgi:iron complex outermembrane recepter protein
MSKFTATRSQAVAIAVVASLGAATVPAALGANELEEVVVTAQKRGAVNVQDLAESIQAMSGATLEQNYATGLDDYAGKVPSLSLVDQGTGQTQIIFRGVTTGRITHSQPQDQSTAGLYLDETPITSNTMNPDVALFDVKRIETMEGPQGTLYGASAMSGAIRIITNEPNVDRFEGKVDLTGSRTKNADGSYEGKGMVNVPLADGKAAIRGSGYYISRAGFIDNALTGKKGINDEKLYGGRLAALWKPQDNFTVTASAYFQKQHSDGRPDEYAPNDPYLLKSVGTTTTGELQTVKFLDETFDSRFALANLTLSYDLGAHTLVSSSSYLDQKVQNLLDDTVRYQFFFGPSFIGPFPNDTHVRDFSQELRLVSNVTGPWSYVAGLYYQKTRKSFFQDDFLAGSDQFFIDIGLPFLTADNFGAPPDRIFYGTTAIVAKQIAGFGEVAWKFASGWEATVGLRWFDWKSDADIHYSGIIQGSDDRRIGKSSQSGVNPKFRLSYRPNDNLLFYGVASKGFRLGGVNEPVPQTLCAPDLAQIGQVGSTPERFGSDSLWNYELGGKTTWLDRRLRVNPSVYFIKWSGMQSTVTLPTCGFNFVDNSGKAEIYGASLEVEAQAGDHASVYLTGSYTHGKLVSNPTTLGISTFGKEGDRIPNVPRYSVSAGIDYGFPQLIGGMDGFARASVEAKGSSYSQFNANASAANFASTPIVPSYVAGDVAFGVKANRWELSLFVKNVTDARIVTAIDTDRIQPVTFTRARPRTIGLNYRKSF